LERLNTEIDHLRRELVEKCPLEEVAQMKNNLLTQFEQKVDLQEVQNALNDC